MSHYHYHSMRKRCCSAEDYISSLTPTSTFQNSWVVGIQHIITIPWKNICLVEIQPHHHNSVWSLLLQKPDENRHCQLHRNSWKMQHQGLCVLTDLNRHTPRLFNILSLSLLLSRKLSLSLPFNGVKMLQRRGLCVLTDPKRLTPRLLNILSLSLLLSLNVSLSLPFNEEKML